MTSRIDHRLHCDGFETIGTIVISYHLYSGTRNGISFSGTSRSGYLPDNEEGN